MYLNRSRVALAEFQADGTSTQQDKCAEHKSRNIRTPEQALNELWAVKLYPQSPPQSGLILSFCPKDTQLTLTNNMASV